MKTSVIASVLVTIVFQWLSATPASAAPSAGLLRDLNAQVLRVQVKHNNGSLGLGSAVVIDADQVVTNCHVVTDARDVAVMINGVAHAATAIKPDWYHDLCILNVAGLEAPVARIGASRQLRYESAVFTVGFPDNTTEPVNTFGVVKGMFPMDGSVVIRATSPFRLGASGGGVFDESGALVGIITLKSRGSQAQYFYMPVEWVQALMKQPAQKLGAGSEKPFWAATEKQRPYFMQAVQPFVAKDWKSLLAVSRAWVNTEPDAAESWFYLAAAEFETADYAQAQKHFERVLSLNSEHSQAREYLSKLAVRTARSSAPEHIAYLGD